MKSRSALPRNILISGVALGLGLAALNQVNPFVVKLKDGRWVLPQGLLLNSNSERPGNPEATEAKFAKIYKEIVAFRERNGRLPYAGSELALQPSELQSDDTKFTDEYARGIRDHLGFHFDLRSKRPDGSDRPATPKRPERDVWVTTEDYVRSNARLFPDGTVRSKPSGFYIVLWSDGKVERVPVGERIWVNSSRGLISTFRGQAGVDPKKARKESEMRFASNAVPGGYVSGPATTK